MPIRRLTHEEIAATRLSESAAAQPDQRFPFIVILENIRSLYNVGSIFRTSDAGRIEALYTVGYTPHPPRPEIDKTALGATRTVPSRHFERIEEAIAAAREMGYRVAALEITDVGRSVFDLREDDLPLAVILGSEVTGVTDTALELCDFSIEIPMLGAKHSLNVAVAYGVMLYEAVRTKQRS